MSVCLVETPARGNLMGQTISQMAVPQRKVLSLEKLASAVGSKVLETGGGFPGHIVPTVYSPGIVANGMQE